jgi:hypothetical protein
LVQRRLPDPFHGYASRNLIQAIAKLGEESGFKVINLLQPFRQDFLETGQ